MKLKIFTDGGSRGNPGPAGAGVVVYDENKIIFESAKYLGVCTNNEAEYLALIESIKWLLKQDLAKIKQVDWFLDSKLVVEQVSGNWKVKEARLKDFVEQVKKELSQVNFKTSFIHVKRDKNKAADALVNQALDAQAF